MRTTSLAGSRKDMISCVEMTWLTFAFTVLTGGAASAVTSTAVVTAPGLSGTSIRRS